MGQHDDFGVDILGPHDGSKVKFSGRRDGLWANLQDGMTSSGIILRVSSNLI